MNDGVNRNEDGSIGGIGWSLITPAIYHTGRLTWAQKALWGRINGLIDVKGYCWAPNEWLADDMGETIKKGTLASIISNMVALGFLRRMLIYKKGKDEIIVDSLKGDKRTNIKGYKLVERRLIPTLPIDFFDDISANEDVVEEPSCDTKQDPCIKTQDPCIQIQDPCAQMVGKRELDIELDVELDRVCVENTDTPANNKNDKQKTIDDADEVITHIENIAEKESVKLNFDRTTKSRADIFEGLKKYSVDELKLVAEMKCKEWIGDAKTMGWVNPNTLFRDGKINNNVVAARAWNVKGKPKVNGRSVGYRGVQSDDDYGAIVK